jgi:hypothetical protein
MDFEKAAANAFIEKFPEVEVQFCHFHLGQSFYRKVAELKCKKQYDSDPEFALNCRVLLALAFVPVNEVGRHFDSIVQAEIIPDKARGLISYFESTYVGKLLPSGKRSKPLFKTKTWNCYDAVLADGDLTNNKAEASFGSMQSDSRAKSKNIWKLLDLLKSDYEYNELKYRQAQAGDSGVPKKKGYRNFAEHRKNIVADKSSYAELEYLQAVAKNIAIYYVDV